MKKIAFLSDPHLCWDIPIHRKDNILETQEAKWIFVLGYCAEHGVPLTIAGDLFDSPRGWRILHWFSLLLKKHKVVPLVVAGQHDGYMRNDLVQSTSLGLLELWGGVKLLGEKPYEVAPEIFLYGASYGQPIPKVVATDCHNILVIHKMITDRPLWVGQEHYTDASYFLAKESKGYDCVHAGDAHRRFLVRAPNGRVVCNTGPLLRLEASQNMMEHHPCLMVYDTESMTVEEVDVPHLPAEEVLSRDVLERSTESKGMMDEFVEHLRKEGSPGTKFDIVEKIQYFIKENSISNDIWQVIADEMQEADAK